MASYPTAEEEKRLLVPAATVNVAMDAESHSEPPQSRRHPSALKRISEFTLSSMLIVACLMIAFGVTSLTVGTLRHHSASCGKHAGAVGDVRHLPVAPVGANGAGQAGAIPAVADAADASDGTSAFARLLEAVSPESLHDLLHEYLPNTYKHGVYPSEKLALEALHRDNAALATSLVHLARRELNSTTTGPAAGGTPTGSGNHTTKATASSTTTGKKVTSVFTSTINGTPVIVTATSIVGVGGDSGATTTASGTLQTGAAVAMIGSGKAMLAEAVAGVLVGALLI